MYKYLIVSISCIWIVSNAYSIDIAGDMMNQLKTLRETHQITNEEFSEAESLIESGRQYEGDGWILREGFGNWASRIRNMIDTLSARPERPRSSPSGTSIPNAAPPRQPSTTVGPEIPNASEFVFPEFDEFFSTNQSIASAGDEAQKGERLNFIAQG